MSGVWVHFGRAQVIFVCSLSRYLSWPKASVITSRSNWIPLPHLSSLFEENCSFEFPFFSPSTWPHRRVSLSDEEAWLCFLPMMPFVTPSILICGPTFTSLNICSPTPPYRQYNPAIGFSSLFLSYSILCKAVFPEFPWLFICACEVKDRASFFPPALSIVFHSLHCP